MLLPVFVESWQIECCMEPFTIGDQVQWSLLFVERGRFEPETGPEGQIELNGYAEPISWEATEQGRTSIQLSTGSANLYWSAPSPVDGTVTVRGSVYEDHHGDVPDDFPDTSGIIRRLRVQTRPFEQDAQSPGIRVPAAVPPTYRDVDTSPKWFNTTHVDIHEDADLETGVLVDLDVIT